MSMIMLPLAAIIMGLFMAILDNTVVNVALSKLEVVFKADLHVIQWVVTAYFLSQAAVIPLSGWLSDRFGAKTVFLGSLGLFTLGSLACALSQSSSMLIGFRVLQGLGGGMLMPIAMTFIYRLAPPDRRGAVMGLLGVPMLLAPAVGPILGGWLVQYVDWNYIFLINVPVGIIAVIVGLRSLPALPALRSAGTLDTLGMILGPLAFASLSYGISESSSAGWTGTSTLVGLAVGSAALLAFILRELNVGEPLLELRVFRSRDFSLTIITQWVAQSAMFGAMFLIPLFFQQIRGYGPFDAGLFMLPQALGMMIFMPIGGRLFDRIGARIPVISGLVMVVISTWFLSQVSVTTTGEDLRIPLFMRGMGMGLMMMSLNTHLLNSAPRNLISRVTSLTSALQNVVSSLAIASLSTVLVNRVTAHATNKGDLAGYQSKAVHTVIANLHHSGIPVGNPGALPAGAQAQIRHVVGQYIGTAAFDDTFLVAAGVAVVGLLLAFTIRRVPSAATQTAPEAEAAGAPAHESSALEAAIG
jgi:EmrB/QacA subfamily drug resistance transporter